MFKEPTERKYLSDEEIRDFEHLENKTSIKDAINYAIDVVYALNEKLPKPLDDPFSIIDDLEKQNFLFIFRD